VRFRYTFKPLFPVLPRMSVCEPLLDWKPIKPKPKDQTVETKHKIEIELTERELRNLALNSDTLTRTGMALAEYFRQHTEMRREIARKAAAAEQRAKDLERIVSCKARRENVDTWPSSTRLKHAAIPDGSTVEAMSRKFTTAVEAAMFANMGEMFRLLRRVSVLNGDRVVDEARALVRKIETGE
jgi:hypothetical protein